MKEMETDETDNSQLEADETDDHLCQVCGKVLSSLQNLYRHLETVHTVQEDVMPRWDFNLRHGNGVNSGALPTAEKSTFCQNILYFLMKHWQVSELQNKYESISGDTNLTLFNNLTNILLTSSCRMGFLGPELNVFILFDLVLRRNY